MVHSAAAELLQIHVLRNAGAGVWIEGSAKSSPGVRLDRCTVSGNRGAAVVGIGAGGVQLNGGLVEATGEKVYLTGTGSLVAADGLHFVRGSSFSVQGVTFRANRRAHIVVDNSDGDVSGCFFAAGAPAMVLQDMAGHSFQQSANRDEAGSAVAPTHPQPAWGTF